MTKAIFYTIFSVLALIMAVFLVLVPILSYLNYQFDWHLGLWVGPSGSKDFFEMPNNLSDFLMYELLFGLTFLVSFGIKKIFDKWDWIIAHKRESVLIFMALAIVAVIAGRLLMIQILGGSLLAAIEEKSNPDLLEAIQKEEINNETSYQAFEIAAKGNNVEAIDILADNGFDINARRDDGLTPVMAAASWYSVESVQALIDSGADVNLHDNQGNTALIYALYSGYTRGEDALLPIVQALLKAGAEMDVTDTMDATPLKMAQDANWTKIAELLQS